MKEINLPSGNYIFVEVPDGAYDFKDTLANGIFYKLPLGYIDSIYFDEISSDLKFEIISTTNDITEKQCKSIVESHTYPYADKQGNDFIGYLDYEYSDKHPEEALFDYMTAKESLQSLIQSVGMDLKNNYLILKKI